MWLELGLGDIYSPLHLIIAPLGIKAGSVGLRVRRRVDVQKLTLGRGAQHVGKQVLLELTMTSKRVCITAALSNPGLRIRIANL